MAAIVELTKENCDAEVKESPILAVVDFWGPKCGPCMALMHKYHELAEDPKIRIVSMTEVFARIIHKVYNYEPISPDFMF